MISHRVCEKCEQLTEKSLGDVLFDKGDVDSRRWLTIAEEHGDTHATQLLDTLRESRQMKAKGGLYL